MTNGVLVKSEDVLAFLPNETDKAETVNCVNACILSAQAQAESYSMTSFADFTAESVPQDIRTAIIKWALADFISNHTNTNYVEGDGNYADRASRLVKEAKELLEKYRPIVAL